MFNKLKRAFELIEAEYKENSFSPIVEDDIVARIYYHLLNNNIALKNKIFMKTRICGFDPHRKYDLVIGKRVSQLDKVSVEPKLVSEFKIFVIGFDRNQLSKRRHQSIEDIKKLSEIGKHYKKSDLIFCFFDAIGWLNGCNRADSEARLRKLIKFRNKVNSSIRIIGILAKDRNDKNPKLESF